MEAAPSTAPAVPRSSVQGSRTPHAVVDPYSCLSTPGRDQPTASLPFPEGQPAVSVDGLTVELDGFEGKVIDG
jgi:hypothetical protein